MTAATHVHGTRVRTYDLFIDGHWTPAASGATFAVHNPANGEVVGRVAKADPADVTRALQAARRAFDDGRWSGLSPGERATVLFKLADLIAEHATELADLESLQAGKPVKMSHNSDIPFAIDNLRFFAGAARCLEGRSAGEYVGGYTSMIRREPLGVVSSITPWNYPFMMAIWKIGPALAAGNTVVLKPASITPLTTLELARLAHEAGLPPGVLNVVTGPGETIGSQLASAPEADMVSLTGDSATGKKIIEATAGTLKKAHLELGGKAAFVVFGDADLEAAAQGAVVGAFINSGQDCTAATRVYVEASMHDALVARIVELTRQIRLGDPQAPTTDMGPLVSAAQQRKVASMVEQAVREGGRIEIGGTIPSLPGLEQGYFYEPTVITGLSQKAELVQQEAFGPVLVVLPFEGEEAGVTLANDVEFGLASSVWTRDVYKALRVSRRLSFGTVWINDHLPIASEMPHGGFKSSGFGKDMSSYSLEEYTRIKHVMADLSGQARKGWHFTVFGDA
jgi:betaine-aldehyde dehydrogenase